MQNFFGGDFEFEFEFDLTPTSQRQCEAILTQRERNGIVAAAEATHAGLTKEAARYRDEAGYGGLNR